MTLVQHISRAVIANQGPHRWIPLPAGLLWNYRSANLGRPQPVLPWSGISWSGRVDEPLAVPDLVGFAFLGSFAGLDGKYLQASRELTKKTVEDPVDGDYWNGSGRDPASSSFGGIEKSNYPREILRYETLCVLSQFLLEKNLKITAAIWHALIPGPQGHESGNTSTWPRRPSKCLINALDSAQIIFQRYVMPSRDSPKHSIH